jgi:hypothetical protein
MPRTSYNVIVLILGAMRQAATRLVLDEAAGDLAELASRGRLRGAEVAHHDLIRFRSRRPAEISLLGNILPPADRRTPAAGRVLSPPADDGEVAADLATQADDDPPEAGEIVPLS